MKKVELILGAISLISFILYFFFIQGSQITFLLSMLFLACLYFYLSFFFLNNLRLKDLIQKDAFKGLSSMRIVGTILMGIALSIIVIGIIFKLQGWPGAMAYFVIGLSGVLIALVVGGVRYVQTKNSYYLPIFKRIALWGVLGGVFLFIPHTYWIELKYSDYPAYVEAYKAAYQDHGNEELQDKVDEEWNKIHGEDATDFPTEQNTNDTTGMD
tara:strand:+ start:162 stop:800 length:639 start_codon:yes stop_codon:yes gene_type:complete